MKQQYLAVFHSRTNSGWQPGRFEARTRIDPAQAQNMNRHFNESGVKLIPLDPPRKRKDRVDIGVE